MQTRFDQPALLWLLLLAVPIVWLGMRSLAALDVVRRWTAIVVRLLVLVLVVLMLAGIQAVRWHEDLTVVAVVDTSDSVRQFSMPPSTQVTAGAESPAQNGQQPTVDQWVNQYLRTATDDKRRDDRIGIVEFDQRASVKSMPSLAYDADPGAVEDPMEGTDYASAIRLGMALFPADSGKRLVLVGDGNDTASEASVLAVAREARAAGIPIDVLPLEYKVTHEVQVEAVYAPAEAREGQTVALRVVLRATDPTPGLLYLKRDGEVIDLSPNAPSEAAGIGKEDWSLDNTSDTAPDESASNSTPNDTNNTGVTPGGSGGTSGGTNNTGVTSGGSGGGGGRYVCVKLIQLPTNLSGPSTFEAQFVANEERGGRDTIAVNNRAQAFTLVHGKGRVLVIDGVGDAPGRVLPDALQSHGIDTQVLPAYSFPTNAGMLNKYDAVILNNVPAEMLSPVQQRLLAQYVNDLGGGMVMVGGPDSFGAGGWTNSPIDQILPVTCQVPSQSVLPSGALVLVIDRSGSMGSPVGGSQYTQQEIANEAACQALFTLFPQDMVGVVAFDSDAQWVVKLTMNTNPKLIANQIRAIKPGGGTNIYPGLEEAYKALAPLNTQDAAVRHVILLTDGQSAGAAYHKIAGDMAKAGITLSTVGVGDGHDGQLLNMLATMTGGTYYPVTNPNQLPQVFIKEARTVRKNLIKETPFNPQFVQTGSPIITGLDSPPPLKGLVVTGHKNDPRVFTPMLGPEGEPLFAHWQVGLGRTAAFTSDATNRWASQWLSWDGYADFWARIVRAIARPSTSRAFDLASTIQNNQLNLRLDATSSLDQGKTSSGSFQNFLDIVGTVIRPDGSTQRVTLKQTGPGVYETSVPAFDTGNYMVSLFAIDRSQNNSEPQAIFGGTSKPPGAELRRFTANQELLKKVAQITGGRVLSPDLENAKALFTRDGINASRSIRPLWRPLLMWLIALMVFDVAVRRIAWDLGAMWGFALAQVAAVRTWLKPREVQSEATLTALKRRAAATDQKLAAQRDAPGTIPDANVIPGQPAVSQSPKPVTTRKFEAAEGAEASEDFAAAVGAATADAPRSRHRDTAPRPQSDTPATTSRLLDAKRRAQQRLDENKDH
ncbi:MAG: VWA domain-containing protein [Phycisphaera sp.]|nr:VWA domain-containing protein [Phycisphaera sp.]